MLRNLVTFRNCLSVQVIHTQKGCSGRQSHHQQFPRAPMAACSAVSEAGDLLGEAEGTSSFCLQQREGNKRLKLTRSTARIWARTCQAVTRCNTVINRTETQTKLRGTAQKIPLVHLLTAKPHFNRLVLGYFPSR